jgi:hypothetical protein
MKYPRSPTRICILIRPRVIYIPIQLGEDLDKTEVLLGIIKSFLTLVSATNQDHFNDIS